MRRKWDQERPKSGQNDTKMRSKWDQCEAKITIKWDQNKAKMRPKGDIIHGVLAESSKLEMIYSIFNIYLNFAAKISGQRSLSENECAKIFFHILTTTRAMTYGSSCARLSQFSRLLRDGVFYGSKGLLRDTLYGGTVQQILGERMFLPTRVSNDKCKCS